MNVRNTGYWNIDPVAMTCRDDTWEYAGELGAPAYPGNFIFTYSPTNLPWPGDPSDPTDFISLGDTAPANGIIDENGDVIPMPAGNKKVTLNFFNKTYTVSEQDGWQRTLVFMYGPTVVGQDMFLRGGIDWDYAAARLNKDCNTNQWDCAVSIVHNLFTEDTTRYNDNYLDWHGAETNQGNVEGSPLVWTTNNPSHPYNVNDHGYGYTDLNRWGDHYWMLDVEMNCDEAVEIPEGSGIRWFELKSYLSNGPGWESNIDQPGAPYHSINHFAQCGKLNVFERGVDIPVTIEDL
jgi:hypothetical protein